MTAPFSAAAAHADYKSPSFTQKVVNVMRKHFPEELAERSWDNVGLLLGNLETGGGETKNASPVVLVTNDLTYAVAKEAIAKEGERHCRVSALAPQRVLPPTPPKAFTGAGAGLVVTFDEPQTAGHIASSLAAATGHKHLTVATPDRSATWRERPVRSVAVCAGSGWDVIKDTGADVFVTGEVSHHSALKAVQDGILLFTLFHSNSERGFLRERLVPLLQGELTALEAEAEVHMSEVDRDPFEIITV
ncbi:NGG1-interacting factor 3 [Verticillium alfalfae VaMs.102]|uniref:NGG1-interacting factor 3 n=1 Tax=Verticillium alfalfae (strain VaMs.102 / ATCC MYA-4576 / FGSC 10136) TaxID=526221 RepID=C9SCZ8_VERA1|nr:NGG1-interacting factor 3 [Verticillium alfalfae VaMs.102]EEY16963.1 NGG1-interacting factor 3 [Verticillium alfalfae VaMs.102]